MSSLLRRARGSLCESLGPVSPVRRRLLQRLSVRSAESSPTVTRRPLCIPAGLLTCASTSQAPETDSASYGSAMVHEHEGNEITYASSPDVRKKASLSRRQKIWRSLKQHTQLAFRSRSRADLTAVEATPDDRLRAISQSQPNLLSDGGGMNHSSGSTPKKKYRNLKGIIRPRASSSQSPSTPNKLPEQHRVEFAVQNAQTSESTARSDVSSNQNQLENGMPATSAETSRSDQKEPSPYVTFLLKISLKEGRDLVIRDASGSSDPYVKFKYKGKLIYKSNTIFKNLNPTWDENFTQLIDDPTSPLDVEVFDYDRFAMDDFMGAASIDLSQFRFWEPTELKLQLSDDNDSEQYMGFIDAQLTIMPQTQDEKEQFLQKSVRTSSGDQSKKVSKGMQQVWNSVVNVVLVEGKNLLPTEHGSTGSAPDPYVKFKLGSEKYKSKAALKTLEPKWLEQFDLHIFDDQQQQLEIMVFDKRRDLFMGRCAISLTDLEREITHQKWHELEDGAGSLLLLLSISGTVGSDTVSDLHSYDSSPEYHQNLQQKYAVSNSFVKMRDVGTLKVKVFRAQGLASADIGGKSDPFCVLELVNARLQTPTEYKTLNPEWNKIFTFNVKDIHSALELTIYDEDPNKKVEFLGKVAVPLLKIKNGEKKWYALKDRKLRRRAKGQILLEMFLTYNTIKASVRTFNPKEAKYIFQEPKFKRQVFMRNVNRVKSFVLSAMEVGAFLSSCWSWESPVRTIIAFLSFLVITYCFELYMLPLCLLLLFLKAYMQKSLMEGVASKKQLATSQQEYFDSDDDDEAIDEKDERRSLKDRVMAIQDTLATVQNSLDYVASLMERVKNTLNFTSPFLSSLAITVLSVATVILYFIPLRWIIMIWGINKFTKKLRSPHAIPNNELLDFLSRVPSDTEIRLYGEFRPETVENAANVSSIPKKGAKMPVQRRSS